MSLIRSPKINDNYGAQIIVVKNLRNVPNSDFLKCFTHQGMNIITTSAKEGDRVVYFPVESKLSNELLSSNNLFRKAEHNVNQEVTGFFEDTGRVRAIKLRGSYSEGFILPLQGLVDAYPNLITLEELENLSTTELNRPFDAVGVGGKTIVFVTKYVIKKDQRAEGIGKKSRDKKIEKVSRLVDDQFKLHRDTPKLAYNIGNIPFSAMVTITEKLHGTSFVSSNVLVKRPLTIIDKIAKFFGAKVQETEYGNVYSSRKVVKNEYFIPKQHNHFYNEDIWGRVNDHLKYDLIKGETVYGEIVGYVGDNSMIQKGYDYGCEIGKHKVYIYRITQTNADGKIIELNYDQIQERAEQLGVFVVPLRYRGFWIDLINTVEPHRANVGAEELLETLKKKYANGDNCSMCKTKVPAEGVCFTIEDGLSSRTYKLKSSAFLQYETKQLDSGEENIEDGQ